MRHLVAAAVAAALIGPFSSIDSLAQPAPLSSATDAAEEPVYVHIAVQGDTLIGLSRRLLVEPRRWPEIGRLNRVANPNRIPVGTELRIPLRLMRTEAASATVQAIVGDVRTGGAPLVPGQPLGEGNDLVTGTDSHATVRLVDGTTLRLRPASRLVLRESRRVRDANAVQSGARLEQGRVEVEAAPAGAGKPGFKIETPQGVLGVRGTEFRVSTDGSQGQTRGEVLEGVVAFSGLNVASAAAAPVGAGFGSVIGGGGQVAPPVRLLDKPDTAELPTLQERILMRFPLKPMAGAKSYRGQISIDASFDQVVADLTSPTPELRFAELPDGDYILRVRGIGELGLEGQNADLRFRLKARPEPPLPSAPAPRAVTIGGKVEFHWTANADAASYRLQIDTRAAAAPFKGATLVRDLKDLRELTATVDGLEPAAYVWRLASVRGANDQGPWGDPREFEIRPPPPVPPPPKVGDRGISFAWDARPGQTFEFQMARDAAFKDIVLERQLTLPAIELPLPGTGRFYVRLRARDPDGFIGPYSTPQFFDLPNCLRDSSGACVRAGDQPVVLQ